MKHLTVIIKVDFVHSLCSSKKIIPCTILYFELYFDIFYQYLVSYIVSPARNKWRRFARGVKSVIRKPSLADNMAIAIDDDDDDDVDEDVDEW